MKKYRYTKIKKINQYKTNYNNNNKLHYNLDL